MSIHYDAWRVLQRAQQAQPTHEEGFTRYTVSTEGIPTPPDMLATYFDKVKNINSPSGKLEHADGQSQCSIILEGETLDAFSDRAKKAIGELSPEQYQQLRFDRVADAPVELRSQIIRRLEGLNRINDRGRTLAQGILALFSGRKTSPFGQVPGAQVLVVLRGTELDVLSNITGPLARSGVTLNEESGLLEFDRNRLPAEWLQGVPEKDAPQPAAAQAR